MSGKRLAIAASLSLIGAVLLVICVFLAPGWDRPFSQPSPITARAEIDSSVASGPKQPETAPIISQVKDQEELKTVDEISQLLRSRDPARCSSAIAELRSLSSRKADLFVEVLPKLGQPLLNAKLDADTISLEQSAIALRPQTSQLVSAAQREIVEALLDESLYYQALVAAKSYYNVATIKETADAVDCFADVLTKLYGNEDPTIGIRFKVEQVSSPPQVGLPATSPSDPSLQGDLPSGADNLLDAISVDDSVYEPAIVKILKRKQTYGSLMGHGNLLLLADRPTEARECFTTACHYTNGETGKLRAALEGIARSIRAQSRGISDANAFLQRLQQGDVSSLPTSLSSLGASRLQVAAQKIPLAALPTAVQPPPMEEQREDAEQETNAGDQSVQISTGFDGSTPVAIKRDSPTHFELTMTQRQLRDWFMFRIQGAKGRTIRVDIKDPRTRLYKWWSLNPVYAYGGDIGDPKLYHAEIDTLAPPTPAWNGSSLPSDLGQQWHWISQTWMTDGNTFSFVQDFNSDNAYIAMRPPHPPSYNEQYINELTANPLAKVIVVGRSSENKPLLLVKISSGGDQAEHSRPCILFYAGEHADEQDAMWVAQGVIEYLLGGSADAQDLRNRFTFLIIPMLDPNASARGRHQGIIVSFLPGRQTPESAAYANWFQSWIAAGNRLDLVFDLHNVQANESANVECALMEGLGVRGVASAALHASIVKSMEESNYSVVARPVNRGWSPDRLGGWLSRYYGALTLAYEINSQSAKNHLNLGQLKDIGPVFVNTACKFLSGAEATGLIADIDSRRQQRLARWAKFAGEPALNDAIESEAKRSGNLDVTGNSRLVENEVK